MMTGLDASRDRRAKQRDLQPFRVDLDRHREAADISAGGAAWRRKLEIAAAEPGYLSESEFHYYRLYDPGITEHDIGTYVGGKMQAAMYKKFNSPYWLAISEDKLLFETVLKGCRLPVAKTMAVTSEAPRFGFESTLRSRADLAAFLSKQTFPIFCKPADGMFGIGAMRIEGFADGSVQVGGSCCDVEIFHRYVSSLSSKGFLFQPCIEQSPPLSEVFGHNVCSIRFLILNRGVPIIESAVLRSSGGGAALDHRWQEGDILAAVDIASGRLRSAVQNGEHDFIRTIDAHPGTGHRLSGLQVGHWEEAKHTVLAAAALFSEVRLQSWDLAIAREGPVIMEFNWGGSLVMHQIAQRRGIMTPAFREHLAFCENQGFYAHPI